MIHHLSLPECWAHCTWLPGVVLSSRRREDHYYSRCNLQKGLVFINQSKRMREYRSFQVYPVPELIYVTRQNETHQHSSIISKFSKNFFFTMKLNPVFLKYMKFVSFWKTVTLMSLFYHPISWCVFLLVQILICVFCFTVYVIHNS